MSEFMPGPWRIESINEHDEVEICAGEFSVCQVFGGLPGELASAYLILSAPDLYAALSVLVGVAPPEWCGDAIVALAKARGGA